MNITIKLTLTIDDGDENVIVDTDGVIQDHVHPADNDNEDELVIS